MNFLPLFHSSSKPQAKQSNFLKMVHQVDNYSSIFQLMERNYRTYALHSWFRNNTTNPITAEL